VPPMDGPPSGSGGGQPVRTAPPRGRHSPVAAVVSSMPLRLALPSRGNPTSEALLAALSLFCVLSSLHLSFLACSIVRAATHLVSCLFLSPIRLHRHNPSRHLSIFVCEMQAAPSKPTDIHSPIQSNA
jgi:hypothetical protein